MVNYHNHGENRVIIQYLPSMIRGKPQTNEIGNKTDASGVHNQRTEPNESKYELGIHLYVPTVKLSTSLITVPYMG